MSLHKRMFLATTIPLRSQVIPDMADEDDINYEDRLVGTCAECGSVDWSYTSYGRYSQRGWFSFASSRYIDYDVMESEDGEDDADPWECENGHYPSDDTLNRLMEAQ